MTDLDMMVGAELPRYRCHKEVWALKIKAIAQKRVDRPEDACGIITPEEVGYAPFEVSADYMNRHKPQVGGYYVVYKDGYQSFSPAGAFEEGYARL